MKTKPLRLGFIGGGLNSAVGSTHFISSQMDSLFRVDAGCFSTNPIVNSNTSSKWNIPSERLYNSWESLLENEKDKLDAIVVLTPTPDHLAPVVSALRSGYPVICEKALTPTSSDAALIQQIVKDTSGILFVTYNYTGYPMIRELREMIKRGKLGKVRQIHIEMPQEGFARLNSNGVPMSPQKWRLSDGPLPIISLDLGSHIHQMIDFLIDEKPLTLVATQSNLGLFNHVVDNTMVLAHYTNDVQCSMWFSKVALGHRNGLRVRIYGEIASAEWFQMNPEILIFSNNRGNQLQIDRASNDVLVANQDRYNRFKSGHPAGFLEAFANLYADISYRLQYANDTKMYNENYIFTAQKGYEGLLLLEAINKSALEQRWVNLESGC